MSKPWTPRKDQTIAVKWLLEHAGAGLFADPGSGKTSIVLAAAKILQKNKLLERVLVVAPKRVCYQVWPAEASEWTDFNHFRVVILHGSKKEARLEEPADIYVINPEGLEWLLEGDRLKKLKVDTLVIDESTKFKHSNSKRFKLLKGHLNKFRRRWILTGTPTPNGYLDLFGQIYIVDQGRSLGQYITHYRFNYFYPTGYGGYTWLLKPGGEKLIQKAISPYILRLEARASDLPAVVDNVIRVELPDKARKKYDELEEDLLTELDNGEVVTAVSSGSALNKCAQVANGGLYYQISKDNMLKRESIDLHDAKTEALYELYEQLQGSPLLVAYEFNHDLERIQAYFGKELPYIGGGVSPKRSKEIEDEWNAGNIPILIGHPASMGHGLNFQKGGCGHVAWYGITWDYELYDQFIRRVRRSGNKHADVFVHHIVARDTVDEAKMRALKAKARSQNGLLTALKDYAKGRKSLKTR